MPKVQKKKVNTVDIKDIKDRIEDNVCDLSLTELSEVPVRQISHYKRITILDISSNKLINLGDNFAVKLHALVKLNLSKNQIEKLPDNFGMLTNLRHLDLYDNKLVHLPISFGELINLRYLDLKGNPLTPALLKVVGYCLTTRDCQDAAKNTVHCFAEMLIKANKPREQEPEILTENSEATNNDDKVSNSDQLPNRRNKSKSTKKKTAKGSENNNNADNDPFGLLLTDDTDSRKYIRRFRPAHKPDGDDLDDDNSETPFQMPEPFACSGNKAGKKKRSTKRSGGNGVRSTASKQSSAERQGTDGEHTSALRTILLFFVLLSINVGVIYIVMFKNPELAEWLVEYIPPQYRNWIVTKTELFRLRVGDLISEFRTPPEEH